MNHFTKLGRNQVQAKFTHLSFYGHEEKNERMVLKKHMKMVCNKLRLDKITLLIIELQNKNFADLIFFAFL